MRDLTLLLAGTERNDTPGGVPGELRAGVLPQGTRFHVEVLDDGTFFVRVDYLGATGTSTGYKTFTDAARHAVIAAHKQGTRPAPRSA